MHIEFQIWDLGFGIEKTCSRIEVVAMTGSDQANDDRNLKSQIPNLKLPVIWFRGWNHQWSGVGVEDGEHV